MATAEQHLLPPYAFLDTHRQDDLDALFDSLAAATADELQGVYQGRLIGITGLNGVPAIAKRIVYGVLGSWINPWAGKQFTSSSGANRWGLGNCTMGWGAFQKTQSAEPSRMGARVPDAGARIPNWTPSAFAESKDFVADEDVSQPAMSTRMTGEQEDYCNNSYFGSANGAKATLDRVLILPAIKKGLQVAAEHECLSLWMLPGGGYRLEIMDHRVKRRRYLTADRVILAAGTLNTLRLLFHSRAIGALKGMPALGRGFSGNGDSVAWWALNEQGADFSLGTPTHGRFALRDADTGKAMPGPYITRFGFNGINTLPLPKWLKDRLRRDAILVGMGRDRADGVALWKRGRLKFRYIVENNGILADIQALFAEVARRSRKPVRFLKNQPLTVHPLGGARLAANERDGVVDGAGQVYGLPGLYIADASALPASPGMPPSMTIAAWSRHLALGIAATKKRAHRKQAVLL